MSLIHKSNSAASVSLFDDALVVSSTPQEIYNDYEARVLADGGTVTDPAATLDAITKAISNNYFSKTLVAVSPSFGIKLSGSNIIKFYNLRGINDIVPDATVTLDASTFIHPISIGVFNTQDFSVCKAGFGMAQSVVSRHDFGTAKQHQLIRSDTDGLISSILFDFNPAARVYNDNGDVTATPNLGEPDPFAPQTLFIDKINTGRFALLRSGVNVAQQVVGGSLYDYVNNSAYIKFTDFVEAWHLDAADPVLAGALSFDQRQRYPAA